MKKEKHTCVMCHKELGRVGVFFACFNPMCPNYGLVALSELTIFEIESAFKKSKRKTKRKKK